MLYALDATNTPTVLCSSAQKATRDAAGNAVKFKVPTVANGKVAPPPKLTVYFPRHASISLSRQFPPRVGTVQNAVAFPTKRDQVGL